MSLNVQVNVTCDGCRESYDDACWTGQQARAEARKDGWRVSLPGGRDLCPTCREG